VKLSRVLWSLLNSVGKSNRQVTAVFGFTPNACHQAVSYLCRQQRGIPVWLFSTVQPASETAALCERVVVHPNAAALLFEAEFALWPRRVVLCAGTWTGEPGHWLLKIAPFLIPPFRALLLNRSGDFMPGRLGKVLSFWGLCLRNEARDLASTQRYFWRGIWRSGPCTRVRDVTGAFSLLAIATALGWFRNPQRALFHRMHGAERLPVPMIEEDGYASLVRYEQHGNHWHAASLRELAAVDGILRLFDDERTFAVALQSHVRGWKPMLLPTAPFRKLQAGEATRVLAPLSETIVVSRKKLAALGAPDCELAATAWLLLFWKAAAAGWRSYAIGRDGPVSAEPDFPVQETDFVRRVLFHKALRMLGPCQPELSRGNVAFEPGHPVARGARSERLRVLVVSPFLPYPLSHGGAVRIFNLCRALSDRVDFGLVAIREAGDTIDYTKLHEIFRNVWVVDLDQPESHNLELPHQVRRHESPSLRALVADLCHNWKPDLLQVEYTHLAGLCENAAGIPALLVEHDLTFGLYRQFADREPGQAAEREYERWLEFEQKWLRVYDAVWAVSDEERQEAMRRGGRSRRRTFTIPNGVDTLRFRPSGRERAGSRPEVLFVGSFRHWPNILAFEKLCEDIMPRVWEALPDAVLRVVAGPNHQRFRQMLRPASHLPMDERVEVLGFVEDLRPLYARADVVVAPLIISSGTNIKVLEAMACGKAIVSTPIGCAGLGLRHGHDVFIRKDWDEFARAICGLLCDHSMRLRVGGNARRTVEQRFSWENIGERAFQGYLEVLGRAEKIEPGVREREYLYIS
jgi:polysaccharide biosynthesis protein PslH